MGRWSVQRDNAFFLLETGILLIFLVALLWGIFADDHQLVTIVMGTLILFEIMKLKAELREVSRE